MTKLNRNRVLNLGDDAILKPTGLDLVCEVSEDRYREIGRELDTI